MIKPGVDVFLREKGILHAAIGAVALAIHGAPRYSSDLDIMVLDPVVLSRSFWEDYPSKPYEVNLPDREDPIGGVVRFHGAKRGLTVDVVVGRRYAARFALETAEMNSDLGCPVVSPLGLTLLKLDAGGIQDLQDLVALCSVQKELTGWDLRHETEPHIPKLSREAQKVWKTLSTLISIQIDAGSIDFPDLPEHPKPKLSDDSDKKPPKPRRPSV